MNEKINIQYALDSQGARLERSNKRLFVLSVVLIIVLFVSNGLWLYHESQFVDEIQIEQQSDGDSSNYIIGGNYGGQANDNN